MGDLNSLVWRLEVVRSLKRPDLLSFLAKYNQLDTEKWDPDKKPLAKDDLKGRLRRAKTYVVDSSRISNFVHPDAEPQASVPESLLLEMRKAMTDEVRAYLMEPVGKKSGEGGRGLNEETIEAWELGWHPGERRICIPIRDEDGNLVSISGRRFSIEESDKRKYLHSPFKRDRILFGAHKRQPELRKGYLVEGFFHVIYAWCHGYRNFVARMGTHLSNQQASKLVEWFDHLVIVPDGNKAGSDSAELIAGSLWGRIDKVEIASLPSRKDIDELDPDQLRDVLG
jgi:hypothetical protein